MRPGGLEARPGQTGPQPCGSDANGSPRRLLGQRPLETTGLGLDAGTGSEGLIWDGIAGRRGVVCDHGLCALPMV